jgi:lipopolysaccharide transport system ATP-binding protein
MKNVSAGDGRTILFVSHNMGALTQLCQYGIQLEDGRVKMIGPVKEVVQAYLRSGLNRNAALAHFPRDLTKPCQYVSVEILHGDGRLGGNFSFDEPVVFQFGFEVREPSQGIVLTWHIQTLEGTRVLFSDIRDTDPSIIERMKTGFHAFQIVMPPKLLSSMTYVLTVTCTIRFIGIVDEQEACCEFTVCDLSSRVAPLYHARPGILGIRLPWSHRYDDTDNSLAVPS